MPKLTALPVIIAGITMAACSQEPVLSDTGGLEENASQRKNVELPVVRGLIDLSKNPANPDRNAYFGDLHVHTDYSFDAYSFGTTATPYDAYRYAKGEAIDHPSGFRIQLQTPLDFYAVTDHAMFLGVVKEAANTNTEFSKYEVAKLVHNINAPDNMGITSVPKRAKNFSKFIPSTLAGIQNGTIDAELTTNITRKAWLDTIQAAKEFNRPGEFTTFVAYEYTSRTNERGNLHRNVIFQDDKILPAVPFSQFNSQNPEGLWNWMDSLREQGIESLAIPHNSNGSNGAMFELQDWAGTPINIDYSQQRIRNEPLVEITQIKGTSETHPLLSPNDEWADFEISPYRVATTLHSEPKGSYVRGALLDGLVFEQSGTVNPYKFGFVGASDTHVGATTDDESSFFSKAGLFDGKAVNRGSVPPSFLFGSIIKMVDSSLLKEVGGRDYFSNAAFESWGASGVTGVWAEQNERDSIYRAFRRKETFATSGPRIRLRFFAGHSFEAKMLHSENMITYAYENGTTMGGELASTGEAPQFLVVALADPNGMPLQRVQIVKGTVNNGESSEMVFDIACSDGLKPNPTTHRCPDNGAKVNLSDCSTTANVGDKEIKALWHDPHFKANEDAFYYVRALENPSCRWSTWDAVKAGVAPREDLTKTLQERAWSSPIWLKSGLVN